jgi:hypothetical protein
MESTALESEPGLASAELSEILGCLGDDIRSKLHNNSASGFAANGHVEITLWQII